MADSLTLEKLDAYDFVLPEHLIAQQPLERRDASRLLVVDRKQKTWEHRKFSDLPEYFNGSDVLVVNNTKVIKARLLGHRVMPDGSVGGKIEFVLLEELRPRVWEGLFHAAARHKAGLKFQIPTPDGRGIQGVLIRSSIDSPFGNVVAELDRDPIEAGAGQIPLPHYIHRTPDLRDESTYQTVYAKNLGSVAAPTAGLHFSPEIINQLKSRGASWEEVTLHVGLGTFRPVKEQEIARHLMHEERYEISQASAREITEAENQGSRITAVGTTSVRTLESAWESEPEPHLRAGAGRTKLFIRPGHFKFQVVDRLITNFHLPKSTLLMLVCAFAGRDLILSAYEDAVKNEYRFFSYGDAMLIL